MKTLLLFVFVFLTLSQHGDHGPSSSTYENCHSEKNFGKIEWTISQEYNNLSMKITYENAGNGWVILQKNSLILGRNRI